MSPGARGLLGALVLAGCGGPAGVPQERTRTFGVGGLLVAEISETDLVVLEPATGRPLFRYRYEGKARVPFATMRAPALVCAPEALPDRLVLRYDESVHVLALPGGELLWQRECLPTACPGFCAATLGDGAVAVVTGSGRSLTLLGADGTERWTRSLGETVVESPRVASGGIVLRTRKALVALDATGVISWQKPAFEYEAAPLAPGPRPVPATR